MSTAESEAKRGIVFTFYSFKGGSGRTMALANVAALLARWGPSVLVIDWDLEAPGLERFFSASNEEAVSLRASRPGVLDLLQARAEGVDLDWRECLSTLPLGVSIISAGREDGGYARRLQKLSLDSLFEKNALGSYIENLRKEWISSFEFVLIDSRTGVTDIGGICTVHLPDVLVLFFTANYSSMEGAAQVLERARKAQERLPLDRGTLMAVPVPARDESRTEYRMATQWKKRFAERFSDSYNDWLPSAIKPQDAVDLLRIPYVPYWSFGERLPVIEEGTRDPSSLGYAYEILARLLGTRLNWYEALEGRKPGGVPKLKPRELDTLWLKKQRSRALEGFKASGRTGFMEAYHFCLDSIATKEQPDLLRIAEQASIPTFGWPIGLVLGARDEFRPRPTNDGILAQMNTGHDYDYWTLTKKGDFYTLMSLFEDDRAENVVFFDTRIVRTTEVVLHSINIYKAFGVEPSGRVSLTIRYGGLKGRTLAAGSQNRLWFSSPQNIQEDTVRARARFQVGIDRSEIIKVVKKLCEPLFVIFDFAHFPDEVYDQIVSNFIQGRVS